MESAEAILENENNSNVESESFIRQQQQLSLQNAASAQDEQDRQSTSEMDSGSGLNEPPSDSVMVKSPHSEDDEKVVGQDESRKDDVVEEHEEETNQGSNELVDKSSHENPTVTEGEIEPTLGDESNTAVSPQHKSQEYVSGNKEEAEVGGEESDKVDESETAMQTEQSEVMNENQVDSSEQALDETDIDRSEDLPVADENIEESGDKENGNSRPHSPVEENSNVEPPDPCQESTNGSETLLQFSPLGDNDLAPGSSKASDSQSCSLAQGNFDSASNSNDSLLDEDKTQKQNSDNERDNEITSNTESQADDAPTNENNEGGEESVCQSVGNDCEEKETASIADGQMDADEEDLAVSQEEENCLLNDDENDNQVLIDKKDECEMELESKESNENTGDDNVQNSASGNDADPEMEVESGDVQENLSEKQTSDDKHDDQGSSSNNNEDISEMEVGSEDKDGAASEGDNQSHPNSGVESIDETSQNDVVQKGESEVIRNEEEMPESPPAAAEDIEEGTVSTALESGQGEEDMEVSGRENVLSGDGDLTDNKGDERKDGVEEEFQVEMEKSAEVCESESVEKSCEDIGGEEKLVEEVGYNSSSSEAVENVDKAAAVIENVEDSSIDKSCDVIENVEDLAVDNKSTEVIENVEDLAIDDKSTDVIENVEDPGDKTSDAVKNVDDSVDKSSDSIKNVEDSSKAVENVEESSGAIDSVEKSPETLESAEKPTEAAEISSDDVSKNGDEQKVGDGSSGDALQSNTNNSNSIGLPTLEKEVSNDVEMVEENGAESDSTKRTEKETAPSHVMPASEIKKEAAESQAEKNENPLPLSGKELKKEIMNDDDDIVILDDDDDDEHQVTVKKETVDDKGKGVSGIQIAAVSGQEYNLHSNASSGTKDSDDKSDKSSKTKIQKCIVCEKVTKCKFNIVRGGDTKQLCDDICFKKFRKTPSRFLSKPAAGGATAAVADSSKLQAIQPNTTGVPVGSRGDTPAVTASTAAATSPGLVSMLSSTLPVASQLLQQQKQQLQIDQQKQQLLQQQAQQQQQSYKTCTVCQVMNIQAPQTFCNWKGFDFCGEICLGKFQSTLRSNCSHCSSFIPSEMRASYCTKIGNIMHPFCRQFCVTDFLKKLKTCACCKQDMTKLNIVIARVGADDRSKEFCSQSCVKKFEDQIQDVEIVYVEPGQSSPAIACSVCNAIKKVIKHTVRFHSKTYRLCSELCLSAFQYTNKINFNKCGTCGNMCTLAQSQPFFIQYEGDTKRFCSDKCINTFRLDNRKLAPCSWCAARKINFDMIERQDENNKFQLFCSLNCLSLFRVNLQAKSNQAVECDRCRKIVPAQYHLTMSDASVRNFCSYACVMSFQSQFTARIAPPLPPLGGTTAAPMTTPVQQKKVAQAPMVSLSVAVPPSTVAPASTATHPHGTRNRGRRGSKGSQKAPQPTTPTSSTSIPVISSVVSLATEEDHVSGVQLQEKAVSILMKNLEKKGTLVTGDGKQRLVVEVPIPKMMKNKAVQCKPFCQTKATACRPHSQHKDCQTDENMGKPVIIPVPVPIYIPMPCVMYQAPAPVPIPFPVPIPVPIFIPTTRKSANGIIKAIKEIQERMPADPLEAEILMMAEAVATDKKTAGDSDSDSEIEGDTGFDAPVDEGEAKMDMPEKEGVGRAEDMIQMALRMAEEMTGPMEDLETSVQPVAVNSIAGQVVKQQEQQTMMPSTNFEQQEEDPDYMPVKAGRGGRGSKRASRGRPPGNSRPKRQRTGRNFVDQEMEPEEPPPPPPRIEIPEPPPDTNYRLKFTYGVNAWKHWVVTKNAELESASRSNPRVRPLPVDVLKCTMDELHFSLCLFIKEVRKPNGEPYSPDSIYYLCLGIQQYLYENGRIDNIFTDLYFQRFTDSLHDVLKSLQPKVNSQGQMLCRIEEEHLWESKQLGAHSPYVLLNTLIYFHTKHFILKTAADHMSLSFAQILKHWKKGVPLKGNASAPKNASLRFYCLANNKKPDASSGRKSKDGGGVPVYEVTENFDNPLRCPVKLYEFFLSKCPESIKNRNDIFYPVPERSCVPDSPVWYSTQSIEHHTMDKMLTRVLLVREIQEAHLHAQPTYIKM